MRPSPSPPWPPRPPQVGYIESSQQPERKSGAEAWSLRVHDTLTDMPYAEFVHRFHNRDVPFHRIAFFKLAGQTIWWVWGPHHIVGVWGPHQMVGVWGPHHMVCVWGPHLMVGGWGPLHMVGGWGPHHMVGGWGPHHMVGVWGPHHMVGVWGPHHMVGVWGPVSAADVGGICPLTCLSLFPHLPCPPYPLFASPPHAFLIPAPPCTCPYTIPHLSSACPPLYLACSYTVPTPAPHLPLTCPPLQGV